jgi:hypothetical protein
MKTITFTDSQMKALVLLANMQFQQGGTSECKSVAGFVRDIILPLTDHKNSRVCKDAGQSLVSRGQAAREWMERNNCLPTYLKNKENQ